jgi:hypothetical protein
MNPNFKTQFPRVTGFKKKKGKPRKFSLSPIGKCEPPPPSFFGGGGWGGKKKFFLKIFPFLGTLKKTLFFFGGGIF